MIFFSLYYVIEKISTDLVISNFSLFCYGVYFGVLLYSVYVLLTISIIEAIETIVAAIVIYIVGMIFTWIVPGC
jgi:hypothetical protein